MESLQEVISESRATTRPTNPFDWLTAHWLPMVAVVAYACGVVWRWCYVMRWHDPRGHVYSDMQFYIELAKRLATAGHLLQPEDVTHPPGMPLLISWVLPHDPGLTSIVALQFLIACGVPLAIGAWAWLIYGRRTAYGSVILASLYFPFIDYAGYFLAEGYVMLLIPLGMAGFLLAATARRWPWALAAGLLSGTAVSVGVAFKLVVLPGILCFVLVYVFLFKGGPKPGRKALAVVALALGFLPGMIWISQRSTRANDGHWVLVSNKNAADFLLGHYGRIHSLTWRDPRGGGVFHFGSPSAVQRGYSDQPVVSFKMTDSQSNSREAWRWIRAHPGEALVLSCEHVYDLFLGGVPWPSISQPIWPLVEAFHFFFVLFLLLPSVVICATRIWRESLRSFLGGREFLVFSPILGVMASAFVACGELRYRIPWDGIFILLAIECYRRAYQAWVRKNHKTET